MVYNISSTDCAINIPRRRRRATRIKERFEDSRQPLYRKTCFQQYMLYFHRRNSNNNNPFTGKAIDLSSLLYEVKSAQLVQL